MTTNPFTLSSFAEWIEKNRSPGQPYDYNDGTVCACAQYAKHLGVSEWINRGGFWHEANHIAGIGRPTFGALAARLRDHEAGRDGWKYAELHEMSAPRIRTYLLVG